ncbi:hypothetical protein AMTRI_Chr01g134750 [Amborella trichopoda]|uniref:nuclear transcription factor Y subunit B-1 isoform X4 n=1 Tax=Amborella trichopoda TaxID=13333 RepID=UPI0009BE2837|nr:nuclear transcription factor Y subunit B-1 isoform X4 [Amborella trichopoda]XP_020523212.1 nuclear transcription factor Y subunit B-1 isoform X4 [Amborella trichopoda]XP_020523213.1 nuclear transcription factor Y subunit B-1 isoform X4 [Amborella trichopoda]|eukprot:XP_020523211.1 nuclear transcription factor Y subunit B-1 isoform X4 [Amborella trichopoda]
MADTGSPGSPESPHSSEHTSQSNVRDQDRYLPIANISRIMKKVIPANGKIAKDAKETVQECVSEFISFITSEASDKCQREKRKTINGDDLLWAMGTLGFEDYIDPLKIYLQIYREMEFGVLYFCRGTLRVLRKLGSSLGRKTMLECQQVQTFRLGTRDNMTQEWII